MIMGAFRLTRDTLYAQHVVDSISPCLQLIACEVKTRNSTQTIYNLLVQRTSAVFRAQSHLLSELVD